ncbi:hypothetical protein MNBD_BACTEROID06-455, partial [hydrothermal vent metagenome]
MNRYGIYGYECTTEVQLNGFRIIPRSNDHPKIKKLSSDLGAYHLTAFLEIDSDDAQENSHLIYDLEGITSFI